MPGTKSGALELLWGSILTNTRGDIIILGIVTAVVVGLVVAFYKEIQATIFHRDMGIMEFAYYDTSEVGGLMIEFLCFKKGGVAWLRGQSYPGSMELRAFLPPRIIMKS